jgi:hypothetical protein
MSLSYDVAEQIARELDSALDKLKASMDEGPDGVSAVLTPGEATCLYRILTEVHRVKHSAR